jgi:dTMP kinase
MTFFNAKVIVFEGADGCGKTTQIKLLKKSLESQGLKVYCTREPGGSITAEKIRKLFLNNEELDIWTQILLCSAARNEHLIYLEELQKKENFDVIIFDRFIDSTLAYQVYSNNLSPKLLFSINREVKLNLQIDCEFILDIDPEITTARRKKISDHYDSNIELLKKVRNAYLQIQKHDQSKILINSNFYPKIVHKQISKYVSNIINNKKTTIIKNNHPKKNSNVKNREHNIDNQKKRNIQRYQSETE